MKNDMYILYSLVYLGIMQLVAYNNSSMGILLIIGLIPFIFKPVYFMPLMIIASTMNYFNLHNGMPVAKIGCYFIVAVGIIGLFMFKYRITKYNLIIGLTLITSIIISSLKSQQSIFGSFTILLNVLIYMAITTYQYKREDKLEIAITLVTVMTSMYFAILYFSNQMIELVNGRLTISMQINENTFAKGLVIIIGILIGRCYVIKDVKTKVILLIMAAFDFYLLICTGSRSSLIALIIAILIMGIVKASETREIKISIKKLGGIILIITIICPIVLQLFSSTFEGNNILNRFSMSEILASSGSGRFDLWKTAILHIIPKNFLIGIGFDTITLRQAFEAYSVSGSYVHNIILDILVRGGIILFILLLIVYINTFKIIFKLYRYNPHIYVYAIPFVALLLIGVGEPIFEDRLLWSIMGIISMLNNNYKEVRKREES